MKIPYRSQNVTLQKTVTLNTNIVLLEYARQISASISDDRW